MSTAIMADSGREASRERRRQLVQGKTGLPAAAERTRNGANRANGGGNVAMSPAPVAAPAPAPSVEASVAAPQPASATQSFRPVGVQQGRAASMARREQLVRGKEALRANGQGGSSSSSVSMPSASSTAGRVSPEHGREASMMRRQQLVRGKSALQSNVSAAPAAMPAASASVVSSAPAGGDIKHGRAASMARRQQLVRGKAAVQGNYRPGNDNVNATEATDSVTRSGSNGTQRTINYPPKVTETVTYGDRVVTGIRIGRGGNVTGDEPGYNKPVTGSQYIGRESGVTPRIGGIKVGASRTEGGLVVTGTQVRNTIKITGDEPNPNLKITGEADQGVDADLVDRSAQQVYSSTQFDRNSSPHGHTVFGYNLGRSAKAIGSRERDRKNAVEVTEKGLSISGVAVGRSGRVTGDHAGSCRSVTGDQYLTPASQLPFCEPGAANAVTGDVEDIGMRERVSGINVEHHTRVTGSEAGHHLGLTGTPYLPQSSASPGSTVGQRVSGNVTLHADHVTGTARGAGRNISGTPYYREEREANVYENARECVEDIDQRFSVRSPQREAQLRVREAAAQAPAGKVTGTFAAGEGKITGNQEFMFRSRAQQDRKEGRITGEGRQEGAPITGAAWQQHNQVTGTEGHFATERNPSASAGEPHAFAGAGKFKGKGNHTPPTSHVTGMVGWSAKTAARVTLSGGAQG